MSDRCSSHERALFLFPCLAKILKLDWSQRETPGLEYKDLAIEAKRLIAQQRDERL